MRVRDMCAGKQTLTGRLLCAAMAAFACTGMASSAYALDAPDAPDRVGAFERRAAPFERQFAATDGGSAAVRAGQAYSNLLDAELNAAYRTILTNLRSPAREALVESQRRWLNFRDAEFRFIARQWTNERSGSSASLSVAGYRNALTKERVIRLLRYAAEHP